MESNPSNLPDRLL